MNRLCLRLYAITDNRLQPDIPIELKVESAIRGGATMIQYREKFETAKKQKQHAVCLHDICKSYNVPLIINDNVMLAKEIDAEGVHIGQNDMNIVQARKLLGSDKIIGVTAKTIQQAVSAYENGADYLGSGAVFGSTTKTDAVPMDIDTLRAICESVPIPVVAIGGINISNVEELAGVPIAGVAVVGGIFGNEDIELGTRRLLDTIMMMGI